MKRQKPGERKFVASLVRSYVLLALVCLTSCTTPPRSSELSESGGTSKQTVHDAGPQPNDGSSTIVKPRSDAVRSIEENCGRDYEIISEEPASSEVGIAIPIGKDGESSPHVFIRYRCKNGI